MGRRCLYFQRFGVVFRSRLSIFVNHLRSRRDNYYGGWCVIKNFHAASEETWEANIVMSLPFEVLPFSEFKNAIVVPSTAIVDVGSVITHSFVSRRVLFAKSSCPVLGS